MTENELRQHVCDTARAWMGCREADGSHRPIIDCYNTISPLPSGYRMQYSDPWCAAFVSAVGQKAGLTQILYPECACDAMIALYRKAGRFEERDDVIPKPGDVIFYDWEDSGYGDCRGSSDHVGLVLEQAGDVITVIEGNRSDAVGLRKLHADSRYIRGYGQPYYLSLADGAAEHAREDDAAKTEPEPQRAQEAAVSLPILRRGDKSEAVRSAQLLLIMRGFRCGPWGADGDFGPDQFQRARKLAVDGVVGPESWRALLRG